MTSSNINKIRKDLLYIPIYSKKKLSRSRSSLNIDNHKNKIKDNNNLTNNSVEKILLWLIRVKTIMIILSIIK